MRDPLVIPLVLLAHGSRDPRAAAATRALARALRAARPGLGVHVAYLDHARPGPGAVLSALAEAGHVRAVVVPFLLTEAYHGKVDVPAALADAPLEVLRAEVIGPDPALLPALTFGMPADADATVLIAAGTSDPGARAGIGEVAALLGAVAAYASGPGPRAGDVVAALRAGGARKVAVLTYFLAPGLLYDRARDSALAAGAASVGEPLWAAPELAEVVLRRYAAVAAPVYA